MEPNVSLLCTQKPDTGPCSQLDKSSPHLSILQLKIQHNINPSTTWSSKCFNSLGIFYQNLEHICVLEATHTQGFWVPSLSSMTAMGQQVLSFKSKLLMKIPSIGVLSKYNTSDK